MVASADKPASGTLATVLGIVMLIVGAAGLFGQLQDALNTVWEVQPRPGRGIVGFLRDRFLSFSMILGTAFLLLVSLVVSAVLVTSYNARRDVIYSQQQPVSSEGFSADAFSTTAPRAICTHA